MSNKANNNNNMKVSVYYPLFAWVLLTLSSYRIYIGTIGLLHSSTNNNGSLDMYQAEFFPPKSDRVSFVQKKCALMCTIYETVFINISVSYVYIRLYAPCYFRMIPVSCLYRTLTYINMLASSNIQSHIPTAFFIANTR